MTQPGKRLLIILLALLGGWFYFKPPEAAIRHAESFLFRRMTVSQPDTDGVYRHFFVTNRVLESGGGGAIDRFTSERGSELTFGSFDTVLQPSLGLGMLLNATDWFQNDEIQIAHNVKKHKARHPRSRHLLNLGLQESVGLRHPACKMVNICTISGALCWIILYSASKKIFAFTYERGPQLSPTDSERSAPANPAHFDANSPQTHRPATQFSASSQSPARRFLNESSKADDQDSIESVEKPCLPTAPTVGATALVPQAASPARWKAPYSLNLETAVGHGIIGKSQSAGMPYHRQGIARRQWSGPHSDSPCPER